MTPLQLSLPELALAALLIVAAAALSWALRLGLQRTLLVSAVRLVVQLVLVGLFLRQVFALSSPWLTALVVAVMLGAATFEVGSRQRRRLSGFWHWASAAAASASPPSASRSSPSPAACARSPGTTRATPSRWWASSSARR